jgi:hypothetical protein
MAFGWGTLVVLAQAASDRPGRLAALGAAMLAGGAAYRWWTRPLPNVPPTPSAQAYADQLDARRRDVAGDRPADYDAWVQMMRDAGAGDLEKTTE